MKINENHSPTAEHYKSEAVPGSPSSAVELARSADAFTNSWRSWRRTMCATDRTSDICNRSSRTRHKRFKSATVTPPLRRCLKRRSLSLPRPPRPRAPEKSLNYLSEISDAEQGLEPQPQASPSPAAQTNVAPVLDSAEIRTGRFWDLSRPLKHLFEAVDEIRRTIGLVHDHTQAGERREPPPAGERTEGGHHQNAPQQDPEWTRDPPPSRRAGLDGTAPPTVREGDVYRADCAVASRADAHSHPFPPDQARGSLPAPPELELLNPSTWPKTNWEPEGTSLGTPVDYWPPQPSCQNFRDRLPRSTIHCRWSRTGSTCWNISTGRAPSNLQTCKIVKY